MAVPVLSSAATVLLLAKIVRYGDLGDEVCLEPFLQERWKVKIVNVRDRTGAINTSLTKPHVGW